jgi:uncharacterized protein (DUF1330 family)
MLEVGISSTTYLYLCERYILSKEAQCARPRTDFRAPLLSFKHQRGNTMNRSIALGLAMLAGGAIGATAIQGLHAQAKPPTYVVVALRKINDAATFKAEVVDKAAAAMANSGGKYVIRTDKITAFDGTPPQRYVLIQFDSPEKAQAWKNSELQKAVDAARMKATDSLSFMVDGMQ